MRPEDFELATDADGAIPATIKITEQLGPELLAHFQAEGIEVAHLEEQADQEADNSPDLSDTLVGRFDPDANLAVGQRTTIRIKPERVQVFEAASGRSLVSAESELRGLASRH